MSGQVNRYVHRTRDLNFREREGFRLSSSELELVNECQIDLRVRSIQTIEVSYHSSSPKVVRSFSFRVLGTTCSESSSVELSLLLWQRLPSTITYDLPKFLMSKVPSFPHSFPRFRIDNSNRRIVSRRPFLVAEFNIDQTFNVILILVRLAR